MLIVLGVTGANFIKGKYIWLFYKICNLIVWLQQLMILVYFQLDNINYITKKYFEKK